MLMKKILRHPLVLSLLIIIGLILINSQGWLKIPQDFLARLTAPGQKCLCQFSSKARNFANFLISINNLNQENVDLQKENQELLSQLAQLKEVSRENEFLRKQLDLPNSEPGQLILANVIGHDSSGLEKYFLINKGKGDGLSEKMAVIAAGNLLVGQISQMTNSFSKVQLINSSDSRINALIQESEITGLVRGDSDGLNLIIDLLPQGQTIKRNETVVTSGLAGFFPAGLLIGQIRRVVSSEVQTSQQAKIKPAVDLINLDKVFVIKE